MSQHETRTAYQGIVDDLSYDYEGVFSTETIRQAVEDARLALEPNAKIHTFLPVLTARFAKEQLLAAAQATGAVTKQVPELLFICVHNAGRSQLAAALADHLSGGRVHVRSAGSEPTGVVNPVAIQALAERGIQLTEAYPKPLTDQVVRAADVIVTMGCGDACPIYPGKRYLDWEVADPDGQSIEAVREIRDDLTQRVSTLLRELDLEPKES
ncbi:arsenate reductase ArsC [Microlunatus sp. GCM10028923]|uniref:arsenate reductase ArsC n=1 Tax=Microlunatus sp. GCM10028923 TaxID=3273400 RepID=UPI00361D7B10